VIKSNDKKRGRLEAMRHVLSGLDYTDRREDVVGHPDPLIVVSAADVLDEDADEFVPPRAERPSSA
jgi:polyphosphate kinase